MQRNMMTTASNFSTRNQLPDTLQNQITDYLFMKCRTGGFQQQCILNSLPNGIRLNVLQYLFLHVLEKVYLFQGVSYTLLLQLVSLS